MLNNTIPQGLKTYRERGAGASRPRPSVCVCVYKLRYCITQHLFFVSINFWGSFIAPPNFSLKVNFGGRFMRPRIYPLPRGGLGARILTCFFLRANFEAFFKIFEKICFFDYLDDRIA